MKRHELDLTSLLCGLVFAAVAAAYLIAAAQDKNVDGGWALPLTLVGLGLAGVAGGVGRAVRRTPVAEDDEVATVER